jgi:hypothetical protein
MRRRRPQERLSWWTALKTLVVVIGWLVVVAYVSIAVP